METKDLIVLSDEERKEISGLPDLFKNFQTAHSEFQIRNFILNDADFPTHMGKYHQCVRELWSRYQNLITLTYEYKKLGNEIKYHELKIDEEEVRTPVSFENVIFSDRKKQLRIEAEKLEIQYKSLRQQSIEKSASETLREMKVFLDIVNTLDMIIPDNFKDETGLPSKEKSEAHFWLAKQKIAEFRTGSPSSTPFNKILGLAEGRSPRIVIDEIGRLVFVDEETYKQIQDNKNKIKNITQETTMEDDKCQA